MKDLECMLFPMRHVFTTTLSGDITTEGDFSFICTVKVYKDNKLFDTKNYNFNKTSIEPAVLADRYQ
jgi:hypothetical protein